jgi:ubiquitin carboxyl-terminal hydrolase 25
MVTVLAQLSDLFTQMAWGDANAITPSIELAKLALVTSKDEEEDEAKANPTVTVATSSSPSTDATLVEEVNGLHPPLLPTYGYSASTSTGPALPANATVLGKRSREVDLDAEKTEQTTADGSPAAISKPRSPRREDSPPPDKTMRIDEPPAPDQEMFELKRTEGQDTNMEDAEVSSVNASQGGSIPGSPPPESAPPAAETAASSQPPPLPKRQPPPLPPRKQPVSDSVMMFGKTFMVTLRSLLIKE